MPFTVRNSTVSGQALAERVLHLPGGDWNMRDKVSLLPGGHLLDRLGVPTTLAIAFDAEARGGALHLRSRALGVRLCGLRVRLPRLLAPRVVLTDSHEEETGRQHVTLRVDAPLLGRLYEYAGSFTYRIEEER